MTPFALFESVAGQQRVGPFRPLLGLLSDLGADPDAVLAAVRLPPDALADPDGMIPYTTAAHLLRASVRATGRDDIGLLLGRRLASADFGAIGALIRSAPDLGTAINDFIANQHRNARGAVAYFTVHQDAVLLGYAVYQTGVTALDQISDMAAAAAAGIVSELAGAVPQEVLLAHAAPADTRPYDRLLSPRVRFDAEQTALVLPRAALALPIATADPAARAGLLHEVAAFWAVEQPGIAETLLRLLRPLVVIRTPPVEEAAAMVGMRPRTLNRILAAEGTNYRRVLADARLETARQLLACTRLPVTQVALALGYAQHSDFTRAFHRGCGMTPRTFRDTVPQRRAVATGLADRVDPP